MQSAFFVALGFTLFLLLVVLLAPVLLRPSVEAQLLLERVQSSRPDQRTVSAREVLQEGVLGVARRLRVRMGMADNAKLKRRLAEGGMRERIVLDAFHVAQFVCPVAGLFVGSLLPGDTIFWMIVLGVGGFMLPDFWLARRTKKRRERMRRSLPDAIDLLAICVDAGLGLDQALLRVGSELAVSHPEINEEFTQVNLEQRAGKARLEAWGSLAERTQIDEFRGFVSMLTQTDRFGTPVLKALKDFSEEIRLKRRQHAEEAAAKTKIKIIFPLVLCIFPCMFIVLLAPAMLSIASGLESMGK